MQRRGGITPSPWNQEHVVSDDRQTCGATLHYISRGGKQRAGLLQVVRSNQRPHMKRNRQFEVGQLDANEMQPTEGKESAVQQSVKGVLYHKIHGLPQKLKRPHRWVEVKIREIPPCGCPLLPPPCPPFVRQF